jgi:hypothetical protein
MSACTGPATRNGDTGAESKKKHLAEKAAKKEKSKVRTRENPNVPMTDKELAEFDAFCAATLQCRKERCDSNKQARVFKAVKVTTEWGESLQMHFMAHPLDAVGRRLARLVDEERLDRKSRSCRDVLAIYD